MERGDRRVVVVADHTLVGVTLRVRDLLNHDHVPLLPLRVEIAGPPPLQTRIVVRAALLLLVVAVLLCPGTLTLSIPHPGPQLFLDFSPR
jgi:hypothetical protein